MKFFSVVAAVFGFSGVMLGALGAHGLRDRLLAADMLGPWETAVLYQLVHAVVLLSFALLGDRLHRGSSRLAGVAWTLGVVGFSGSLYLLALGGPRWLGPVTPLGGLALLIGWAAAGGAALRGLRA